MAENDIEKTGFRSQNGHYEFVAHLQHMVHNFEVLKEYSMFVKLSKCSFGKIEVDYLGHIITQQGVIAYLEKIKVMKEWHVPTNLKGLKGFLGLTWYYRRFGKEYGLIAKPMTDLLKKDKFE
ncbi:uncharacterized mitochondrial protein AtMg00860-like [Lycium barbarum]|uniref:uncharacterized mitochondrial protein AtMg00860-like n=1 Tax=Lycium barbarum TaxID=112863 RepID=UPI00293F04F6|nr:uncharacterized mitochondrial protein AtMg00860-like [Lycium barbarum]